MFYEQDLIVLADTPASDKKQGVIKLTDGVVHYVSISFRAGCHNMVFATVNRAVHQIFPTNPDGYIKGNDVEIRGRVFYPLFTEPYELDLYGWSPDTAYNHTVTFRFWMLRLWQMIPYSDEMYQLMVKEGEI